MANRNGPDFENIRVAQKPSKWGGRNIPVSTAFTNMMWNFIKGKPNPLGVNSANNSNSLNNLRAFWYSDPNVDDDENENQRWYVLRPLGDGGYGHVALWVREDQDTGTPGNTPLDHCAIKQFEYDTRDQYAGLDMGVVKEAVYQHQLNGYPGGANVLFLRRFKAYFKENVQIDPTTNNPHVTLVPSTLRAYFDYAPHGNLWELMKRYEAFDKHLPEAFIWHVFHSLAQAVLAMNDGPWTRLTTGDDGKIKHIRLRNEVFLNHFDMKPENIFLGISAAEQSPTAATGSNVWNPDNEYPQILLADFGFSERLTRDNKNQDHQDEPSYIDELIVNNTPNRPNPRDFWNTGQPVYGAGILSPGRQWNYGPWGSGTPMYQPPEQLRLGSHWVHPPNGLPVDPTETGDHDVDGRPTYDAAQTIVYDDANSRNYRFKPASNIWAVGKIIYDLAYHTKPSYYLEEFGNLAQDATAQEARYKDVGGDMLDAARTVPALLYTDELQDLIYDCMNVRQRRRPNATDLVRATKYHLDACVTAAQTMTADEREALRVFYKGNEINQMTPGPCNFDKTDDLFDFLMKNKYQDPALEQLNLPDNGWQAHKQRFQDDQDNGLQKLPYFGVNANGVPCFVPPQVGRQPNPALPAAAAPVVAAPVVAQPVVAAPAAPQRGDPRAPAADGTPRFYCGHTCRAGTRLNGVLCRHNCCQNGAKN